MNLANRQNRLAKEGTPVQASGLIMPILYLIFACQGSYQKVSNCS